jgi:flagellar basal-body rod protein FlgB
LAPDPQEGLTMIDALFGKTNQILEKSLEVRMLRQNLLASNIANAETPGYRAKEIDFKATMENLMAQAVQEQEKQPVIELERTSEWHFDNHALDGETPQQKPGIVFAAGDDHSVGNDSNNVSVELELGRMQMNTQLFGAASRLLSKRLSGVREILDSVSRT